MVGAATPSQAGHGVRTTLGPIRAAPRRDPAFAEKVADVIGLYLEPPGGAVVLSIDEKTQIHCPG